MIAKIFKWVFSIIFIFIVFGAGVGTGWWLRESKYAKPVTSLINNTKNSVQNIKKSVQKTITKEEQNIKNN